MAKLIKNKKIKIINTVVLNYALAEQSSTFMFFSSTPSVDRSTKPVMAAGGCCVLPSLKMFIEVDIKHAIKRIQ